MLSTGLLSLNIHEALSLDGAELCLHPDLFLNTIDHNNPISGGGMVVSSNASAATAAGTSSESSPQGVASTLQAAQTTPPSNNLPPSSNAQQPAGGLSVGDMIEIRVWDPLSKSELKRSPAASVLRKQSTAGTTPRQSPPIGSTSSVTSTVVTAAASAASPSVIANSVVAATAAAAAAITSPASTPPVLPLELGVPTTPLPAVAAPNTPTTTTTIAPGMATADTNPTRPRLNSLQYSEHTTKASLGGASTTTPSTTATITTNADPFLAAPATTTPGTPIAMVPSTPPLMAGAASAMPPAASTASVGVRSVDSFTGIADLTVMVEVSTTGSSDTSNLPTPTMSNLNDLDDTPPTKTVQVMTTIATPTNTTAMGTTATSTLNSTLPAGSASPAVLPNNALPPVFPRGRANTQPMVDGSVPPIPPKQQIGVLKRPVHRRTPSANANMNNNNNNAGNVLLPDPQQQQTLQQPQQPQRGNLSAAIGGASPAGGGKVNKTTQFISRHNREISDMTMDTHQLDVGMDSSLQLVESNDEGDMDDTWSKVSTTHRLRLAFVLLVTEKTLTSLKGNARTQVSMLRQVADLYSLSSYDMVTIHKIDPQGEAEVLKAVSADFVLVTIKDQFISRGDMHFFQNALIGAWIYEGQRLSETTRGIKANAREIRHGNHSAKSGIVTRDTMITFRSRSARIFWLVQLSCEMWDYTSPYEHDVGGGGGQPGLCEIYFDQWIRFIYKLFAKWKELEVSHSLTVVFFSRTIMTNSQTSSIGCRDVYGRSFEDHYKAIIENETVPDWESLVVRIKEEFIRYPREVGWTLDDRRPSSANQGNVLEAINVTLNLMQFHYLDRDLHRTGNSIVVVSPGCGVFEVDKGLAGITYQRMMDNGIGSDMLSLGLPPLHIAPFFLYNNEYRAVETRGVDTSETYYEVPHWMHLSFIHYDKDEHDYHGEDVLRENKVNNTRKPAPDPFEVAANGFLRPQSSNASSSGQFPPDDPRRPMHAMSPKSFFSALGNAAATPGKLKITRERQLISGRKFRDILEACRPRPSGDNIPSALSSVLKIHQHIEDLEKKPHQAATTTDPSASNTRNKTVTLKEWGSVDFADYGPGPTPIQTRSEIGGAWKYRSESFDQSEVSDAGSVCSSVGSHVSSIFGMSYDRVMWGQSDSPIVPNKALQMQRSPSLEFERLDASSASQNFDSDTALSEDSMSVDSEARSRSSARKGSQAGTETDSVEEYDTNESQKEKLKAHADHLRQIMAARDASFVAPLPPTIDPISDVSAVRPDAQNLSDSEYSGNLKSSAFPQNSRHRGKEAKPPGGLGAALSQYGGGIGDSVPSADVHSSGKVQTSTLQATIPGPSQFQQERTRMGNFFERGSLARSPMFIAPSMAQVHDPPDIMRPDDVGPWGATRMIPLEGRGLVNRDGIGYSTLPAASRHLDYTSSSIFASTTTVGTPDLRPRLKPIIKSIAQSPPRFDPPRIGGTTRDRPGQRPAHTSSNKQHVGSRRKKAFNPFRQRDEDEVLAIRSHNRRRWSHVFPVGEIEFKRHTGPIWKSLTAPAILPLSVDYFPSPQELRDENTFQFSPYTVTLGGLDKKYYSTHAELLMEMVRQRLTQDFQLVTPAALKDSESRPDSQRQGTAPAYTGRNVGKTNRRSTGRGNFSPSLPTIKHDKSGVIKHYLSMGHRIQVLNYDPSYDTIEIVHYNRKSAQNDPMNVYTYMFLLYSKATEGYLKTIQTFKKYGEPYKWNKVDNLICGEEDRTMEEGMRFRRIMFALIPDRFNSPASEQEYISKFKRLLEYLSKLREDMQGGPDVTIISSANPRTDMRDEVLTSRRSSTDAMKRFTVQLRKGKRDPFEWVEIAIDSTFDTARSYRIMFNWLVASSAKVEAQVQLLHRRCTQFGLRLTMFPQRSISRNLYLHPFVVPPTICIRDKEKALLVFDTLMALNFVYDGIHFSDPDILECIDDGDRYDFPKHRNGKIKSIPARQLIHRTGALFIRTIIDRQGWAILVLIENNKLPPKEDGVSHVRRLLHDIALFVATPINP